MIEPCAIHTECRDAMVNAMRQFSEELTPQEMLAIAAQVVGQLIALQDQRVMTPEMAMDLVQGNIVIGNETVTGPLQQTEGNG